MHVVRHVDVSMNLTAIPRRDLLQAVSVETIILVSEETRRTVAAALNDMERLPRYHDSWKTGHDVFLFVEVPGVTLA